MHGSLLLPAPLILLLSLFYDIVSGTETLFPPAVPLAVRSPVFNTWVDSRSGENPAQNWPVIFNDQHITGWCGYARVDQVAYHIWGDPGPGSASTWLGTTITPTRTIFTVQAGPLELNITFLSPIEPADPAKQSFPGAYVYVEGTSTDGKAHTVQLYADISAEWVSNSESTAITWSSASTTNAAYHQTQPSTPGSSFQDVPEDAIAWHAIALSQPGRQSIIATDQDLRPQLASNATSLTLSSDLTGTTGFIDNNGKFPVFAHLVNLGSVSTVPTTAWALGVLRDPITTFQNTARHSYWWSAHATIADAIDAFISDFAAAKTRALALDQQITTDANAVSAQYADVVALGLRQALAGYELTVSPSGGGGFNTSDLVAFMKDTGNSQRVNPTEGILAMMPALMYLNASMIGPLIEPLLRFQQASAAGYNYALPDLGSPYPSVPGNTANNMGVGVENSGNMLIVALAHARGSGDGTILGRYYSLFQTYAAFLANNTFSPDQQTADSREPVLDQTSANITNLGVKGIVGLRAMVQIAEAVGDKAGAAQYASLASNMTATWTDRTKFSSGSSTGLAWIYQDGSSEGLMYNLYADKLLGLGAFDDSIYQAEANGYSTSNTYGVALSSDSNFMTRSDWILFTAAALSNISASARDSMIAGVHVRASANGTTNGTFANVYNVQTGAGIEQGVSPNGFATPAQGAMLSVLALGISNKTISVPSSLMHPSGPGSSSSGKKGVNAGAIAGGVIGGVFILCVVAFLILLFVRRRREQQEAGTSEMTQPTRPYSNRRPPPSMPSIAATQGSEAAAYGGGQSHVPSEVAYERPFSPPAGSTVTSSSGAGRGYMPVPVGSPPPLQPNRAYSGGAQAGALPTKGGLQLVGNASGSDLSSRHTRGPSDALSGTTGSGVTRTTRSGTEELRTELATLRREMEQLRAQTEAPPVYQPGT